MRSLQIIFILTPTSGGPLACVFEPEMAMHDAFGRTRRCICKPLIAKLETRCPIDNDNTNEWSSSQIRPITRLVSSRDPCVLLSAQDEGDAALIELCAFGSCGRVEQSRGPMFGTHLVADSGVSSCQFVPSWYVEMFS